MNMALAEASPDSSTPAAKDKIGLPSASNWAILQLEKLNFPLQRESHSFEDLQWEHNLSKDSLDILSQLRYGFGLHQEGWCQVS
jgi:hypothetical protein